MALLIEIASTVKHVFLKVPLQDKNREQPAQNTSKSLLNRNYSDIYHPNIIRSFEPNIPQAPQIDLFHNTDLGTTLNFSEMFNYYIFLDGFAYIVGHF